MNVMRWTILGLCLAPLAAGAGGDEVVVLYNNRVPASKTVADHYAAARHVPAPRVLGFSLTTNEVMSRADFDDFLQKPLADELERAGLWKFGKVQVPAYGDTPAHAEEGVVKAQVRYAVLCYGMPLKIAPSPVPDPLATRISRAEFRRDEAAVDSELAWLPRVKTKVELLGPLPNSLYGCTNRALLSPTNGLLLVARLDGPTPEIANALVDKALAAERDGLWGRTYFDLRNEPTNTAYYLGDQWLRAGAEICRHMGFDMDMDTNYATFPESYPMSHIAIYAGWYDGDVSGPFKLPKVEFMPGAFAYHLHSFSAETLRSTTAHWCGPLLAKGATCTMGCVYEPYLQFTPNIAFFLESLGRGCTFGEAAWASQTAVSWQNTVIGDPLYQPFPLSPGPFFAQLLRSQSPQVEWVYERLVNLDRMRGVRELQLQENLESLPLTAHSAILTEKLADLCDDLGKPSSAVELWQNALQLNPSPQQRLRLRRTLGTRLLAQGRKAEALENYKQMLAEAPDYPGAADIQKKVDDLSSEGAAPKTEK